MFLLKKTIQECLSFFVIFFVLSACQNNTKEIDEITKKEVIFPTERGKKIEILYTDSGLVKVRLTAPVMNHYTYNVKEHYTEMPKGLFVEFFNEKKEVKTMLKANYGVRYEDTKKTEVKYKVQVTNVNGEVLNTEQLFWDEATRKIYTKEFVKITTKKKDILKGNGLIANEDFTEWSIENPVGTITTGD